MSSLYRLAGAYFACQATAVTCWWTLLLLRPEYRIPFRLAAQSEVALLAFWLPDLILLVGGSVAASLACFRKSALAIPALWLVTGSISYATLYCLAGSLLSQSGWLGVVLMAPAMLLTTVFTLALSPQTSRLFRQARPASARWNLTKTAVQIVFFWGMLLFLVPFLLVELQKRAGISLLTLPPQRFLGVALFLAFSALGLWSGVTMARFGHGTPLPLDSPRLLVVRGPYALVRNPMVIAGLGQGAAVGIYTGSILVLAYVLLGAFIWQYVACPLEEEDLLAHFGAQYEQYRQSVRCWCPRRSPFRFRGPTR